MADMYTTRDSLSPSDSTSNDGGYYSTGSPPYTTPSVPNTLPISKLGYSNGFQTQYTSNVMLPEVSTQITQFSSIVTNTPSPSIEMRGTVFMQRDMAYQPNTFGAELQSNGGVESYILPQHTIPTQRQTVINDARARYSGSIPSTSGGHMMSSRYHSKEKEASESISQWSQWLKGSAPAPVF